MEGCELVRPRQETTERVLKKLQTDLPNDPAIPLQGTYPEKNEKTNSKAHMHPVFTAALFTIAEHGSNPSIHQQTNGENRTQNPQTGGKYLQTM